MIAFTEVGAQILGTLRPSWEIEITGPGRLRGADRIFELHSAYAHHLGSDDPAREVLSAALSLMLLSREVPAARELLVPWLVQSRRLALTAASADETIPSSTISPSLREVLAFACEGTARLATARDLETLGMEWTPARAAAIQNALDGVEVRVRPTADGVWRVELSRGWPIAAIVGGPALVRRAAETVGIVEPVCLLSAVDDLLVADLADPSAIDRLTSTARPPNIPVPPASLGAIALSPGRADDWMEVPVAHPESFVSALAAIGAAHTEATVVRPMEKHDGRGRAYWVAEWPLDRGRFLVPLGLDILIVSRLDAKKPWESLPRSTDRVVEALGGVLGDESLAARYWVVDVADPNLAFRAVERLPLHDPVSA